MEEKCPICSKRLYSIITRRIGDTSVCMECGDTLSPLVSAILDDLIMKCVFGNEHNVPIKYLIPILLNDYKFDDIKKQEILTLNEVSRR